MNIRRILASILVRLLVSERRADWQHFTGRLRRRFANDAPVVHYFHQVDDPYSHLALQTLARFQAEYPVRMAFHLAPAPEAAFVGGTSQQAPWALRDAADIAPFHGLAFPGAAVQPQPQQVQEANAYLARELGAAGGPTEDFLAQALEAGRVLWSGNAFAPATRAEHEAAAKALAEGQKRRAALGHYQGAMFHFEGEWYWGVDRLHLLETRLRALGLWHAAAEGPLRAPLCCPPPVAEPAERFGAAARRRARAIRLTCFPSLRSPYTAISFGRVRDLASRSGVTFELCPVLPMVMRGVALPRAKGLYILRDTAREATHYGERFGRVMDPIGEPVLRAFSLLPFAEAQGRAAPYLQSALDAAFADGIDIGSGRGLRRVVERAGLSWRDAQAHLDGDAMTERLAANRARLTALGLWGVPSFAVASPGEPGYATWGQDRLWRVETEIARRLARLEDAPG